MADVGSTNRHLFIKRYERDKLVAQANILSREIRTLEIRDEIAVIQGNIDKQQEKLSSFINPNPNSLLETKKYERDRLSLQANIQTLEIRILEKEEEINRCNDDFEAQKKVISEMDFNIKQQKELIIKEKQG